jgi:hypothetical protein
LTKDQLQALTHDDIILFAELMDSDIPAEFDMNHRDHNMTWDDILRLHKRFVLCQPNGQRWGQWGWFKCGCDEGFKDARCRHTLYAVRTALRHDPDVSTGILIAEVTSS